jgi:hypothetical protein
MSVDLGLEAQLDAERAGALLQEAAGSARAAAEAVAADAVHACLEMDLDVVPVGEVLGDRPVALRSYRSKVSSVSSEKTTPKPKVSSEAVALEDVDVSSLPAARFLAP